MDVIASVMLSYWRILICHLMHCTFYLILESGSSIYIFDMWLYHVLLFPMV